MEAVVKKPFHSFDVVALTGAVIHGVDRAR
jgi:hypothetical protein